MRGKEALRARRAPRTGLRKCFIYLPQDLAKLVDAIAEAKGMSFSSYARDLIAIRVGRPDLAS
jgi:hypothetical protein